MSHFAVLVIGDNAEDQLQPYHEYECTGTEDQYVIHIDKSDEINKWLSEALFVGVNKKENELDYEYDEDKAKENMISYQSMSRVDYFIKTGKSIDEEIIDYHGVTKMDGKWTRYTNPNAKWDWYVLGGRYTGILKLKNGTNGKIGRPGLMTKVAKKGYTDSAQKKYIDFDGMRNESAERAANTYDKAMKIIGNIPENKSWDEIRDNSGLENDEARKVYWNQPRCAAWSKANTHDDFGFFSSPDDFLISKEQYIQEARESAVVMFALVKDSKWYERGKMGWWAFVSDEKEKDSWNKEFSKLLDEVPDDTLISIYDCHI